MLDIPSKAERDMQQGPLSEFPTAKTKKRFNQKFGNVLIYWQSAKRNGNSCFFPIQWVMQKVRSRNISVQKAFLRPSSEESEEPLKRKREKKKKRQFLFFPRSSCRRSHGNSFFFSLSLSETIIQGHEKFHSNPRKRHSNQLFLHNTLRSS